MTHHAKGVLLFTCLILAIRSSASSWDFWPFNRNAITVPAVKIFPESENNFIFFKNTDPAKSEYQQYVDSINRFLIPYNQTNHVQTARHCDFNNPPTDNSVCTFDRRSLGPCSELKNFGFSKGTPCVFFTLSQVLNWKPIFLNGSDIQQHSDAFLNMPDHLNSTIAVAESEKSIEKYIWLTCDGDTPADREFIGPVSYYPQKGFPGYYFPFTNVAGYLSPVVAVHFEHPMRNVVITIECKAWAKNIPLDQENGIGFVKFYLLID